MKLSKTTKIGLWVIICLIILIWGFNFLKGRDIFRSENIYYAKYKDVSGLTPSTIVTLNGLKIGYVRRIYFAEDLSGDLIAQIAIYNRFPLPVGSSAEIASTDLLGSRVMKINLGHSEKFYHPQDTLMSKVEFDLKQQVSEQLAPLKTKAERLIVSMDSIITSTSKVLNPQTQQNIKNSIDQFSETMENLNSISRDLSEIIGNQKDNLKSSLFNLNQISTNLKKNSEQLDHMMNNFSGFSDTLARVELTKINSTIKNLDAILNKIESSSGTLGMLVNDPSMYKNLNNAIENLSHLLADFQQNPKRYVHFSAFDFGRNIVINPSKQTQQNDSVTFKVLLFSSASPVDSDSTVFKGITDIQEVKSGKRYYYFTGNETSILKIREILIKVQSAFPEATLKAFLNGREIPLKKGLKTAPK